MMLSYEECKELFKNVIDAETVGSDENLKGNKTFPLKTPMSISNFGMKQTRGCCLMKNVKDCLVTS